MKTPQAQKKEYQVESPFGSRSDEYYWLRDDERKNPEMLQYLNDENAYADDYFAPLKDLQEALYQEQLGRIKEDDSAIPYLLEGFWYYTRTVAGKPYPIYARRPANISNDARVIHELNEKGDFASEQIILDVNQRGEGLDYYSAFPVAIAHETQIMAYAEDTNGRRQYVIKFRDLNKNEDLDLEITGTNASASWDKNGDFLYYIENDAQTLLSNKVWRFDFKNRSKELIYEEKDDSNYLGLGKTRDKRFILLSSGNTTSTEIWYCDAEKNDALQVFAAREKNHEYSLDHYGDTWYIVTNRDGAENFKIMTKKDNESAWQELIPHRPEALIEGLEIFDDFLVVEETSEALDRLYIMPKNGEAYYLPAPEALYSMSLSVNPEPKSASIRYGYNSMVTPSRLYQFEVATQEQILLKEQIVKDYQPENYRSERLWITARDGVKVPVSIVYHHETKINGCAPLLLYGYGSYGHTLTPSFSSSLVSLLDRGMIYAIAHIRGGQELGRQWYENGKLQKKKNTFNDFIDVSKALIELQYSNPKRMAAMGGSAGGLLMGAVANDAPELYAAMVSHVPFVDVVTTMLDESIPLTTNEYEEWGNPGADKSAYDYMLSYSPYDNLRAQNYPSIYVSTGLWDSQVQYWEPAKYVARLRDLNKADLPIIFRINMEAGHGGKSGRYQRLRENAEVYAYLIKQLNIADPNLSQNCPF